ncbi:class I SAM-dependent methyltransferase [Nocardiopsis sp. JB363]|uniref:class I SAM-dependent methyltransferase n=1 Tax=Nocardiopsis sp. JB363 TaxID=1434837 RepID=UPI00190E9687|nr:class I SAM-dependent methyltransferase [Nocardiopsis sp. JB363]
MDDFIALVEQARTQPLRGWDFSFVKGRMVQEDPPWSYGNHAHSLVRAATGPVLDLGTGGGEVLAELAPLPPGSIATEDWPPNVVAARTRLASLGVTVVRPEENDAVPLPDARFPVVLNRHSSYTPGEVHRLLSPGGRFLTQQVGADDGLEINDALGLAPPARPDRWDVGEAAADLERAGLVVTTAEEARSPLRFHDVGALVFHLRRVPWQTQDFDVARTWEALRRVHERILVEGALVCTAHRFLVEAHRPRNRGNRINRSGRGAATVAADPARSG